MAIARLILFMTSRYMLWLVPIGGIGLVAWYCDWILLPGTSKIRKRILQSKAQPGLFFFDGTPESIARKIEEDPLLQTVFERLDLEVEEMLRAPLFNHEGDGLLPEHAPQFMKRIFYLSFKYLKCQDRPSFEMALNEMRYVSGLKSWIPSDHLTHSVVTAAMAIGFNWLGRNFDSADRTRFADAILKKGLKPIYRPIPGNWWKIDSFNHAQVGYGCLGLAACALMKEFPKPASKIVAISITNMSRAFKRAYRENGEYIEGTSYWIYGTSYSVLFLSALEKTFGHAFQLDGYPAFLNSSRYFFHSHGSTTLLANFSDSNSHVGPVEIMFWFAKKLGDSTLPWFEIRKAMAQFPSAHSNQGHAGPFLPLMCLWATHSMEVSDPTKGLCWTSTGDSSLAIHRAGWGKNDPFIALKGGCPSARHAHMDVGAFVLEMEGIRWGIDLGNVDYGLMKKRDIYLWQYHLNASRWKVFRLNNFSHNTLTMNGKLQNPGGRAKIVHHSHADSQHSTIMDLSDLYRSETKSVYRSISLLNDGESVLIEDEILAREKPVSIRWAMATRAVIHSFNKSTLGLEDHGKKIWLSHSGIGKTEWRIFPSDPPPANHDQPNPNTRMVGFYVSIGSHERIRISVRFHSTPFLFGSAPFDRRV